jgi:hypothetical protein
MANQAVLRRMSLAGVACIASAVMLTACGSPDYTYVKNSNDKLYFKVPATWERIDQGALDSEQFADPESSTARVQKALNWSIAYDADTDPSPRHIFGPHAEEPVVYARVQRLLADEQLAGLGGIASNFSRRGEISFDKMHDVVLPVTSTARQAAAQQGIALPGFELLIDEVITPGDGLRGVHSVFNYRVNGVVQTFDQTVLANDDASKEYLLLVRCSARCYREQSDEISTITKSMTVRA